MSGTTENIKMNKQKFNWRDLIFYCFLIALPIIQFCVMYIGINFDSFMLSFQKYDNGLFVFDGLNTIKEALTSMFTTRNWGMAFLNTFLCWFLGIFISTPITFSVSYFIYKSNSKFSEVLMVLLFLPSIIPGMVKIITFQFFIESAIPKLLFTMTGKNFGPYLFSFNPVTRFISIWLYGFWSGFGSGMLIYINAMKSISPSIVEAAEMEGCGFIGEFFHITFPLIFPIWATFFAMGLVSLMGNQNMLFEFYGLEGALTDNYTVGYFLYQMTNFNGSPSYPLVSAIGLVLTAGWLPIAFLIKHFVTKMDPSEE